MTVVTAQSRTTSWLTLIETGREGRRFLPGAGDQASMTLRLDYGLVTLQAHPGDPVDFGALYADARTMPSWRSG
jgi:hypothetical protein